MVHIYSIKTHLKEVIESLSENLSSLQSIVKPPEQSAHEPMSTNTLSELPFFDPTCHQHPQAPYDATYHYPTHLRYSF